MTKVGLDKTEVAAIFRRVLPQDVQSDPRLASVAKAIGEIVEENNEKLWDQIARALHSRGDT